MKIIYILCEGQTEETFVNKMLCDFFALKNIRLIPIVCVTKRTVNKKYKGGVSNYSKIKNELLRLCHEHKDQYITTMFDYYALPDNTPAINILESDIYKKINIIEKAVEQDLVCPRNLKFNLIVHEFEGLLFSDYSGFSSLASEKQLNDIKIIRENFISPEHINNSSLTAPSKRLEQIFSSYSKISNGIIVSQKIGLHKIMNECFHFKSWIEFLIQNA